MNISEKNYPKPSPLVVSIVRFLSFIISKLLWQIEYVNIENIPNHIESGLLVTPNHQTYFDPFWVCIPIRRDLRFMTWDKAFEWFFIGHLLRLVGAFPMSLKRGGTIKALKESLNVLKAGKTLIVFPEGEREFADGKLLPFKTGAVRLALEANVPILPVTIRGGNKIWSRDHKFPRPGKVQIIFHPVIEFLKKLDSSEDLEKMTKRLENTIASSL